MDDISKPIVATNAFALSSECPTIYQKCHDAFGVNWDDGVVITYGDVVYCKYPLSQDLIIHESVHVKQQTDMGVEEWWDKYLIDKEFRLSQEVPAYKEQIKFIVANVKDRNWRFKACHKIWQDMERMYGNMVSYADAKKLTQ